MVGQNQGCAHYSQHTCTTECIIHTRKQAIEKLQNYYLIKVIGVAVNGGFEWCQ